jgi:hypothetical protein
VELTAPPPSGAEVKHGGAIPKLPHISLWHGAESFEIQLQKSERFGILTQQFVA